jgi:hypothetical protein
LTYKGTDAVLTEFVINKLPVPVLTVACTTDCFSRATTHNTTT